MDSLFVGALSMLLGVILQSVLWLVGLGMWNDVRIQEVAGVIRNSQLGEATPGALPEALFSPSIP